MANIKIIGALMIVLAMDLFMFLGQTATFEIANADGSYNGNTFMHGNNTWIGGAGSNNVVDTNAIDLPSQNTVTASDGSVTFTDAISVSKSWLSTTGEYFVRLTGGPVNYVKNIGLPPAFAYAVGAFWYLLTVFLIVAFILGRE